MNLHYVIIFLQNLINITDNVYNPQNQAAYTTLDEKNDVSFQVNRLLFVVATV